MKKNQAGLSAGAFFTLNFLIVTHFSFAVEIPKSLSTDSRIAVITYEPNNIVQVNGTTFIATQIIFSDAESIQEVQNGDLAAWTTSINKNLPNMLFIKPTVDNSETNMTIVTNLHTYYFHLSAHSNNPNISNSSTYAIRFIYPQDQQKILEQAQANQDQQKASQLSAFSNPRDYNWNYSFSGDKTLIPLHVFDDGKFTYFQLQPNQVIPAIFSVTSPDGKESVVNFRREDQASGAYIVLLNTAPQWTLRAGRDHVASIFNNSEIAQLNPKNRF